jgi:FkbH-like protein
MVDDIIPRSPQVKCVVWDLDNTLWHGVLMEDGEVVLREGVAQAVRELDARGIVQSVASRNDAQTAQARLREAGLAEYFLVPQIGWSAKSESVRRIATVLNLGLDAFLFLDDDPFEREEVSKAHPQVRVAEVTDVKELLSSPALTPATVTVDGSRRRLMYQAELQRTETEQAYTGTREEFLASLDMRLAVRSAEEGDLRRAEELTVRTHQLNATGYTYSYEELDAFRTSSRHSLIVAELSDRFGDYGAIGLALIERDAGTWTVKLLLVSCRVMARGIGTVLLNHIVGRAKAGGVRLIGEFVPTRTNRPMLIAYRFAGFETESEREEVLLLERRSTDMPVIPGYIQLDSTL